MGASDCISACCYHYNLYALRGLKVFSSSGHKPKGACKEAVTEQMDSADIRIEYQ